MTHPAVVSDFVTQVRDRPWLVGLHAFGSLATGEYRPGRSDVNLVAVMTSRADRAREDEIRRLHRGIAVDPTVLECTYVALAELRNGTTASPAWVAGELTRRTVSPTGRLVLGQEGLTLAGRPAGELWPSPDPSTARRGARFELATLWADAARRPWWWLDTARAERGLVSIGRCLATAESGVPELAPAAIERLPAPRWLAERLIARRATGGVASPAPPAAWAAWRVARAATRGAGGHPEVRW